MLKDDEYFMRLAIAEAMKAYKNGEVPVGCIIVDKNQNIIARAHNTRQNTKNPINHAEVLAVKKACKMLNQWMLDDYTMYVTLEPCLMCAGVLLQSRVKNIIYGAKQPKFGVFGSIIDINSPEFKFNHKFDIKSGILEDEISEMMKKFFKEVRKQ